MAIYQTAEIYYIATIFEEQIIYLQVIFSMKIQPTYRKKTHYWHIRATSDHVMKSPQINDTPNLSNNIALA